MNKGQLYERSKVKKVNVSKGQLPKDHLYKRSTVWRSFEPKVKWGKDQIAKRSSEERQSEKRSTEYLSTDGQFSVSVNDAWPKLIFPPQKYAKHEHLKKIKREDHDLSAKYVRKQIVLSNIYAHWRIG